MAWGMSNLIKIPINFVTIGFNNLWRWFMPKPVETDKTIQEAWKRLAIQAIKLNKDFEPKGQHWFYAIHSLLGIRTIKTIQSLPKGHPFKLLSLEAGHEHKLDTITKELKSLLGDIKKVKEIDFSELTFDECIDFSNFIFPKDTSFKHAKFPHDINFLDTIFLKDAVFNDSKFFKNVYFNNAVFYETADFEEAIFQGKKSHCKETAKFRNTVFAKIANFRNATFWGYANFKGAKLAGRAFFQEAKFKWHAPRFYDATFNNEITWAGIKLPKFKKAPVDKCRKATDDELTKFGKKFVYFNYKDTFKNFKTLASLETFKTIRKNKRRRIEENQNSYENIAILLDKANKYHDQHFFFRQEMRCRRWLVKNCFIRFPYTLYQYFADYGYGVGRAFSCWFAHICFWAGILFLFGFKDELKTYERFACSALTSVSNAHSFLFSKGKRLNDCYEMASDKLTFNLFWAGETILGVLFLFLLLLTLRVRFRINNTK